MADVVRVCVACGSSATWMDWYFLARPDTAVCAENYRDSADGGTSVEVAWRCVSRVSEIHQCIFPMVPKGESIMSRSAIVMPSSSETDQAEKVEWFEPLLNHGYIPDQIMRMGIRHQLRQRVKQEEAGSLEERHERFRVSYMR